MSHKTAHQAVYVAQLKPAPAGEEQLAPFEENRDSNFFVSFDPHFGH